MLKNRLLINATLRIVFLSETQPGSVHDKRMADMTPYPLPAGSQLLQDLGFQGFTLEGGGDPPADEEAVRESIDTRTESRQPRDRAAPGAHRACQ